MKEIPKLYTLGLFLPVLLVAQAALADVAADLKQAEELYEAGQYEQAEQAYQSVLSNADPEKPEEKELAFTASQRLPVLYLATDRQPQAQATVQQLLANHADHERLPHGLHEIVERAKDADRVLQAGQIYQNIVAAQPEHPQAIWLKMGVAIANAHLGNDEAVDSTLQNIIAQHAADTRAAEALGQTAWAYRKLEDHEKARTVYQYVVDNWPEKDRAIFSQRGIILCSLKLGDQETADTATHELLTAFSDDDNLPLVTWTVAKVHRGEKDWERCRPLCEYILTNHPNAADAIWAQQALIFEAIDQKDAEAVKAGVQQLRTKFAGHQSIASATYGTARKLNGKDDAEAGQLYQFVVDDHPSHDYAPFAKVNLGQIKIRQGDEAGAEAIFEAVLAEYQDHPRLAESIHLMAEGYFDQAQVGFDPREESVPEKAQELFARALAKWDHVITRLPQSSTTTAQAYHYSGACYRRLGQHKKAAEYYQTVVERWPSYDYAWHLQYSIGHIYERLKESGTTPASEADPKTKAAYEQLLAEYPGCPAARAAQGWLSHHAEVPQGGEQ
jgi:tetratricopeptide (TPR) repeat protein